MFLFCLYCFDVYILSSLYNCVEEGRYSYVLTVSFYGHHLEKGFVLGAVMGEMERIRHSADVESIG